MAVREIPVWSAMPGPQRDAIECPLRDMFYGGQRFGGKTYFLLGDFGIRADRYGPDFQGVLFRRTYDELTDVIERSKRIYGPLGWQYNESAHTWTAPRGEKLFMRYLDVDADAEHYKGWNNQWLGFDELDQWPSPEPIDKLWATLRSARNVPCVRRSTGNPGGPGHSWIKKRYRPHTWRPGQPYVYSRFQPQPQERPDLWIEAVYVPARLEDNLLVNREEYEQNLAAATAGNARLYRAWRYGDWDVLSGAYFDIFDPAIHTIEDSAILIRPWDRRWMSQDWGFNPDPAAAHWHAINERQEIVTYREMTARQKTAPVLAAMLVAASIAGRTAEGAPIYEKLDRFVLSHDAFATKQSMRTIADEMGVVLTEAGLPAPTRADASPGSRVSGWQLMYQLLQSGHWKIARSCGRLIEALPLLLRDEGNPNDCADHPMDHWPDSARMGLSNFLRDVKEPIQVAADRMVRAVDPTVRAIQHMKAEAMLEKASKPVKVRRRRSFY